MKIYEIITLITLAFWLLVVILTLLLNLVRVSEYFEINSKIKWLTVISLLLIYCVYQSLLFFLRYSKKVYLFCLKEEYYNFCDLWNVLLLTDKVILCFFFMLVLIFMLLVFALIMKNIKFMALNLLLYLYQYKTTRKLMRLHGRAEDLFLNFFLNWVTYYTKNDTIFCIARRIWPISFIFLERLLFFFLLPYLIVFDFFVNETFILTMYTILPWYGIYAILRQLHNALNKFIIDGYGLMAYQLYYYEET